MLSYQYDEKNTHEFNMKNIFSKIMIHKMISFVSKIKISTRILALFFLKGG